MHAKHKLVHLPSPNENPNAKHKFFGFRYVIFCQMEEYQAEVARAVNNVKHIQR